MQTNEIMCDKCRKSKILRTKNDIIISFAKIDFWHLGQHRTDAPQRIDLCEECYEKFLNFLEGGAEDVDLYAFAPDVYGGDNNAEPNT